MTYLTTLSIVEVEIPPQRNLETQLDRFGVEELLESRDGRDGRRGVERSDGDGAGMRRNPEQDEFVEDDESCFLIRRQRVVSNVVRDALQNHLKMRLVLCAD